MIRQTMQHEKEKVSDQVLTITILGYQEEVNPSSGGAYWIHYRQE